MAPMSEENEVAGGMGESEAVLWARSGAMALTGAPNEAPRLTPWNLASGMAGLARRLAGLSAEIGHRVEIDGPALLGERAALAGFSRQGWLTVGGGGRMMRAADGWVVIQLPRRSDWDSLAALTGSATSIDDWSTLERHVGDLVANDVVETGQLLGLAVAACEAPASPPAEWVSATSAVSAVSVVSATSAASASERRSNVTRSGAASMLGMRVVDLSALWAGPLCADLLSRAGASITKVEDIARPDGARRGPRRFFELLHRGHHLERFDFGSSAGRDGLRRLIENADVVIEASRPRALEQLGILAAEAVARGQIWLSITAYGRFSERSNAIGFGDDAAVAAGAWLAPREEAIGGGSDRPMFVGDALADPVTGLTAAVAVLECLDRGGQLLDVALQPSVAALMSTADHGEAAVVQRPDGTWWVETATQSIAVAAPHARDL